MYHMNLYGATRPQIAEALENQGYRLTKPRRAILNALEGRESFTAEEIVDALPRVGRATVFRTFRLLVELGVVCKLSLADGAPHYSLPAYEHHHHTVCVNCGNVSEFRAATLERLMRALDSDIPGDVIGHRLELYINCTRCLESTAA